MNHIGYSYRNRGKIGRSYPTSGPQKAGSPPKTTEKRIQTNGIETQNYPLHTYRGIILHQGKVHSRVKIRWQRRYYWAKRSFQNVLTLSYLPNKTLTQITEDRNCQPKTILSSTWQQKDVNNPAATLEVTCDQTTPPAVVVPRIEIYVSEHSA